MVSPFRYHNGKEWLVSQLKTLIGPDLPGRVFYDLCCGGLNVSLGLKHPQTIAVDINPFVIGFYKLLQRGVYFDPDTNTVWTGTTSVPFLYGAEAYESYKAKWNGMRRELTDEMLIIFYILTQMSFSGLIRFGHNGEFNVSYGAPELGAVVNKLTELSAYVHRLRGWTFLCQNVTTVSVPHDAVVYVDPPYAGGFSNYSSRRWSLGERELLAERFERHQGPIIISDTAEARDIYIDRGFDVRVMSISRWKRFPEVIAAKNVDQERLNKFLKIGLIRFKA